MATRKIIFLIVVGILGVLIILGVVSIANRSQDTQNNKVASLSIWVVGGTTEDYMKIFSGFNGISNNYKNTLLDVRVFPNYSSYRDTLLSTLDTGKGPDIFMIEGGGDEILASKSTPAPEPYVNLSDFEKRYEDIFLPLLGTEGEGKDLVRTIKGVPLGYETLGVFYNKAYFPNVPKTWNDVGLLYNSNKNYFPVNIGLGPRYTPEATDIIAYFFIKNGVTDTKDLPGASAALDEYLRYGNTQRTYVGAPAEVTNTVDSATDTIEEVTNTEIDVPTAETQGEALNSFRDQYDETGFSTVDSFMLGKIGMVVGFPSTIREIEKAQKRAGETAITSLILTERIPQNSLGKSRLNIARYKYLAISSKTSNGIAAADFLNYLMDQKTLATVVDVFPYLISPDRTISQTQGQKSLSTLFARAYLDSFIPEDGETLQVYNYGIKSEYEKIFEETLDRKNKIDINNTLIRVKDAVECRIESSVGGTLSDKCLK